MFALNIIFKIETLEEENNDENVGKGVEEITVEIEKDANPDVIDISEGGTLYVDIYYEM